MDDTSANTAVFRREHVAGFGAWERTQLGVEHRLVEFRCALEVGGGNFKPGDGIVLKLAHGISPCDMGINFHRRIEKRY